MDRRVVITGLGVLSPVGIGPEAYWQGLLSGTSGVRPVARFDVGDFPVRVAAEVPKFKPRDYVPEDQRKSLKVMSWDVQLGVSAAMKAVEHSRIITPEKRVDPTRLGVSFGCGFINSDIDEMASTFHASVRDGKVDYKAFGVEVMRGFFPLWLLKYLPNMPACHVSIFVDAEGPNNSLTSGDAASAEAVGEAFRVMRRGWADVMICGGVDAKVNPLSFVRYHILKQVNVTPGEPATLSRPFEKSRAGFVIGEGSASVILETYEHAKARGAAIYGEVLGFGGGCDAYRVDRVHPDGRGWRVAMKGALRDAKLNPGDVDAVFAQANGSVEGDRAESRAIASVFGEGKDAPPVTSTKSMIGYISAAGGILDVVAAVGAMKEGAIPPTLNYDRPDPECRVNVVAGSARKAELDRVLVNAGGFGGQFASLVIGRTRENRNQTVQALPGRIEKAQGPDKSFSGR